MTSVSIKTNFLKLNFLILILIILPVKVTLCQHYHYHQDHNLSKRFKVGNMYYATSYRGLKMFMKDTETDDPALHKLLTPAFMDIEKKIKTSRTIFIATGVIGTTLVIGGLTFLEKDDEFWKPGETFYDENNKSPNMGVVGAGLGVYLVGGIIGLLSSPGESDIYNFINLHNKNNPKRKMDWQLGLDMSQRSEFGLKLTMSF